MNFFNDGGGSLFYKYLQTKHKKWIFSATVRLRRKRFIFLGRYLKADHFENKLNMGGGLFKNAKGWGGGLKKLGMLNLTYRL